MILSELASALGSELKGDGSLEITGVAGMEHATPTEVTFLANPKYAPKLKHTRAAAVLVAAPVEGSGRRSAHLVESVSRFRPRPGPVLSAAAPQARDSSAGLRRRFRHHRR